MKSLCRLLFAPLPAIALAVAGCLLPPALSAQTNILTTNPLAQQILLGNYNPADYAASFPITDPASIAEGINSRISPDSLRADIIRLSEFKNRNTGADTLSNETGIGAARRWVHQKFEEYDAANQDRLVVSYLQFDMEICSVGQHRNIMAVLPGADPTHKGVVLIEGHIDSRCAGLCDTACLAEGVEDNASGTALVMELARVMSAYTFPNTLVFLVVIGEEQGLLGAQAFANYAKAQGIPLRAVLNNDVVGGILCGKTSSPPSCPGLNDVDSTSVRLFSAGGFNSKHKQLARFIKLEYQEMLLPIADVPMLVRIMSPEDRTGRGGDHIPFREKGFAAMRFTAANEHGDASLDPGYMDRQHTSDDVLGVDTDGDGVVDSFFVDFNYLARNAVINGNAAAMAARNVPTPTDFQASRFGDHMTVAVTDSTSLGAYRVALRTLTNDWDTVYAFSGGLTGTVPCPPTGPLFVSVAGVDEEGIESLFSQEKLVTVSATEEPGAGGEAASNIRLLPNHPNPFDEATWLSCWVQTVPTYRNAAMQVTDMQGRIVETIPVKLHAGLNEVLYTHGYGMRGTFAYALWVDGKVVGVREMVFAN